MGQGLDRHARWIGLLMLLVLPVISAPSSPTSTIAHLEDVQMNAAKVDASGNIYLAGQTNTTAGSGAAYIAKLTPDGTTVFAVTLGGSGSSISAATVLDIDSTGAVYVAGTTTASDFPISTGAAQSPGGTAFAAKLDPKGSIVYSVLIGGNAKTQPRSIVINTRGELVVSGQLTASTASALFLLKLSADGTQVVVGPQGIGGLVATDAQDNIYVAGSRPGDLTIRPLRRGRSKPRRPRLFVAARSLAFHARATNSWQASLQT